MALKGNCKSKRKYIAITFESDYFTESNTEKIQRTNTKKTITKKRIHILGAPISSSTTVHQLICLLYVKSVEPLKYSKI